MMGSAARGELTVVNIPHARAQGLPDWAVNAQFFPAQNCARMILVSDREIDPNSPPELQELSRSARRSLVNSAPHAGQEGTRRARDVARTQNSSALLVLGGCEAYQHLLSASLGLEGREVGAPHSIHDLKMAWHRFSAEGSTAAHRLRHWIENIFRDSKLIRSEILSSYRHSSLQHVALELSALSADSAVAVFPGKTAEVTRLVRLLGRRTAQAPAVAEIILVNYATSEPDGGVALVKRDVEKGIIASKVRVVSAAEFEELPSLRCSHWYVCLRGGALARHGPTILEKWREQASTATALVLFAKPVEHDSSSESPWFGQPIPGLIPPQTLGRIYHQRLASSTHILNAARAACALCAERRTDGRAPRRAEIRRLIARY